MIFLLDFYDISVRLKWDLKMISVIFLEDFFGNSMGCL